MTADNIRNEYTADELETLNEAFKAFDKDGDGLINEDELSAAFADLGAQRRRTSIKRMMKEASGNPALDLEEFLQVMKDTEMDGAIQDMLGEDDDSKGFVAGADRDSLKKDLGLAEQERQRLSRRISGPVTGDDVSASLFGAVTPLPDESAEFLNAKIAELDQALQQLPKGKTKNYRTALEKCPERFTDKFKVMFLRSTLYHAAQAAVRICRFWDRLVYSFGPEKAFLPLTQEGALRDDLELLKIPFVSDTHKRDANGQHIMFFNWEPEPKHQDPKAINRVVWYHMQTMIENDEQAQQNGVVFVARTMKSLSDWNVLATQLNTNSLRFCAPMRLGSMHFCYPPTSFHVLFQIGRVFFGELGPRMKIHRGTTEQVMKKLQEYGLEADVIPTELGGSLVLDHEGMLAENAKAERAKK